MALISTNQSFYMRRKKRRPILHRNCDYCGTDQTNEPGSFVTLQQSIKYFAKYRCRRSSQLKIV